MIKRMFLSIVNGQKKIKLLTEENKNLKNLLDIQVQSIDEMRSLCIKIGILFVMSFSVNIFQALYQILGR